MAIIGYMTDAFFADFLNLPDFQEIPLKN